MPRTYAGVATVRLNRFEMVEITGLHRRADADWRPRVVCQFSDRLLIPAGA